MAKGTQISINLNPDGTLNYVNSFQTFKEGDLSDSLNTRVQQAEDNNVVQRSLVKGTRDTFDFAPEAALARKKVFQFRVESTTAGSYQFSFYTPNNVLITTTTAVPVVVGDINTTLSNLKTAIDSDLSVAGQTFISSIVAYPDPRTPAPETGYYQVEITTIPYWDYQVTDMSVGVVPTIVVAQTAVDTSEVGDWIPVAPKDLNGDLFSLWTTKRDLPIDLPIVSGINDGAGGYAITFASNHNYVNYGIVILKGTPIDGEYIVQLITPTTLRVLGTTFTTAFTGGTATLYPKSLSEFGVATRDNQTLLWSYIRLVRTDQWNIRAVRQPEIGGAEDNIFRKSFYWDDDYNPDRVFYYKGAYIQDGAIYDPYINNTDGEYNYTTIGQETKLIQNNQDANISFVGQADGGGALTSGTYRYSGRFLSDDRTPVGLYLETTGQINVYSAAGTPSTIGGDEGGSPTAKVNNLTVTFDANLFRYFELIAIYYTGGSVSGTLVKRVEISNGQTSLNVSHTGSEPNTEAFDAGQLLTSSTIYDISKTLTIVDNFLVRSNMKTSTKQYDFSGFFRTFLHTIEKKDIGSIGCTLFAANPLKIGEYQNPINMESFGGVMIGECVRLLGKVRYKNGYISPCFWIDDVLVDFNLYNIDPAYTDNRRTGNAWNANGYIINNQNSTYVPYINFYGYDLNYIIDGVPVSEIIDEIIIERASIIREVLSSGITVMGVDFSDPSIMFPYFYDNVDADVAPFPAIVGDSATGSPLYPSVFTPHRIRAFYYSMDGILNGYPNFLTGDKIISYGQAFRTGTTTFDGTPSITDAPGEYAEYMGITAVVTPDIINITDAELLTDSVDVGGTTYTNLTAINFAPPGGTFNIFINQPCIALHLSASLNNSSVYFDYGMYQTYYYRGISTYNAAYNPDTSKYGDRKQSQGVTICETINTSLLSGVVISGSTNGCFLQDTFTQGTFLKFRAPIKKTPDLFVTIQDANEHEGFGGGLLFYSQNLVNSQMIFKDTPDDFNTWNFPNVTGYEWMYWWKGFQDNVPYDQSYGYINKPVVDVMFDAQTIVSQLPATYFYSARKPLNSFIDPYRQFFPLNFVDEDLSNGEIVHHVVFKGHIYGLQPYSIRRRFLNSNAVLQPSNTGSEVILGDGNVLAKVSIEISNIGCDHKFGVQIGRSQGGNDVMYWTNTILKILVRHGLDGTVPISQIHKIEPFLRNNLKWVVGKDTPAAGEGICCTWNNINSEWIITVKGFAATNDLGAYDSWTTCNYLDEASFGGLQYIAKETVMGEDPDTSSKWVLYKDIDGNYSQGYLDNFANLYTLVFSEIQNGFSGFRSFTPDIYFEYKDTYLSSGNVEGVTGMFEHEVSTRAKYYGVQYDGYDEWVVAQPFNQAKNFGHNRFRTSLVPASVDYETNKKNKYTNLPQTSYLVDTDFTLRNEFYDSSIRWDASVSSVNPSGLNTTGKNGKLVGDYIKIKLKYVGGTDQQFNQAQINFNVIPKLNNR